MRSTLVMLLLMLTGLPVIGQSLSVNGSEVPGFTLSLVEGVSYAPAGPYADALGARMTIDYGSGLVSLELGGRLVVVPTFTEFDRSAGPSGVWNVNGVRSEGRGAVFEDGQLYLPVSAVAQAFLGYTTYVPERERVMVVLPRGRILDFEATRAGSTDRLVVTLGANVPYSVYYNEPLNTLELRFARTDTGDARAVEEGRYFSRAAPLGSRGAAEVSISLEEGVGYAAFTVPLGRGYQLIVDLFPRVEEAQEDVTRPRVVIDAAHGGNDPGMALEGESESQLALAASEALAEALRRRGVEVQLTRVSDHDVPLSSRSGTGVGADLFLSIHVHPSPDDTVAVYYLSEAAGAAGLDMALRQNAEAELQGATDELRRRLLLNLVPDIQVGRRYAQGLYGELFALGGFRISEPQPAPLAVLAGAAGRGLLVELPPAVSTSEALVEALADAVAALLPAGETGR